MKFKLFPICIGILFCIPVFAACGDKDKDVENPANGPVQTTVSVSPESLNPDYTSQTMDLTITAGSDWAIRTDADWISLRPAGGVKDAATTVKVTVDANKGFESRSASLNVVVSNNVVKTITVNQGYSMSAYASVSSIMVGGDAIQKEVTVTSNGPWTLTSDADWINISPASGQSGETTVKIDLGANTGEEARTADLILSCGDSSSSIKVTQQNFNITAPEGYSLVWNDEFNIDGTPGSDWVIENQPAGWVNNELQTYTSRKVDDKYTLECKDGFLHINCFKGSDGKVYSGRMNAKPSTGWQYGYVEARINLPKGKGTWPAFWMMPSNVDWTNDPWPHCGEIDIMEEVGVDANHVSSSLHTGKYNHTQNTQKTHEMYLPGAEGEFHVYALEWDAEKLTTYVDGKVQLSVTKASMGSDHESWPFDRPFYPILNLAWGGDWGGYAGVDESKLPVTMLVDYVRIFQKQ